MTSRLFLVLALALIGVADALLPFPGQAPGLMSGAKLSGADNLMEGWCRTCVSPVKCWPVRTQPQPSQNAGSLVELAAPAIIAASGPIARASGGDVFPSVDEPEAHNADTAAEEVIPAAIRTTDRSKEAMDDLHIRSLDSSDRDTSDRSGRSATDLRTEATIGKLTWVHPDLTGGLMRDAVTRYDPEASGLVAATSWPIGTVLEVRGPTGRSMMLEVRDTGLLGQNHLDTSEADFVVLVGDLGVGVAPVGIRALE